jgi:hypothetical protein
VKQGTGQRNKGKTFERWFARWFREAWAALGASAKRGWQSRLGGKEEADVETFLDEKPLPIHWELTHAKAPSVWAKYEQAVNDKKDHETPIVVAKRDGEQPMVFLSLEDFSEFLDAWLLFKAGQVVRRGEEGH